MPVFKKNPDGEIVKQHRDKMERLGIIRMGKMATSEKTGTEYPVASDHFEFGPGADGKEDAQGLIPLFGEKCSVIEPVYFAVDDDEIVAPNYLTYYTRTYGLTCRGDGIRADRLVDLDILEETGEPVPAGRDTKRTKRMEIDCRCPLLDSGECREQLRLQILIPSAPGAGYWQISTGGNRSIENIQGMMNLVRSMAERVSGIPLSLSLKMEDVFVSEANRKVRRPVLHLNLHEEWGMPMLVQSRGKPGTMLEAGTEWQQEEIGDPKGATVDEWMSDAAIAAAKADESEPENIDQPPKKVVDSPNPTRPKRGAQAGPAERNAGRRGGKKATTTESSGPITRTTGAAGQPEASEPSSTAKPEEEARQPAGVAPGREENRVATDDELAVFWDRMLVLDVSLGDVDEYCLLIFNTKDKFDFDGEQPITINELLTVTKYFDERDREAHEIAQADTPATQSNETIIEGTSRDIEDGGEHQEQLPL